MNVNIKLTLSDQDRNMIARKIAGKDIKRLCSRAEVVDLVNGFMAGYLTELTAEYTNSVLHHPGQVTAATPPRLAAPDLSRVPEKYADQTDQWKVSYLRGRYGR